VGGGGWGGLQLGLVLLVCVAGHFGLQGAWQVWFVAESLPLTLVSFDEAVIFGHCLL
jgi:hypothetical protein